MKLVWSLTTNGIWPISSSSTVVHLDMLYTNVLICMFKHEHTGWGGTSSQKRLPPGNFTRLVSYFKWKWASRLWSEWSHHIQGLVLEFHEYGGCHCRMKELGCGAGTWPVPKALLSLQPSALNLCIFAGYLKTHFFKNQNHPHSIQSRNSTEVLSKKKRDIGRCGLRRWLSV